MPGVAKHRQTKKATVLIKKTHAFTSYPKCYKSYKPLYEKVKNNNHHLAKALSKEKQENNLLFNRNVALDAENQELIRACNKRDRIMSTMLADAKNMVKMLVTATGYLTNYISSCQEFTSRSMSELRLSCNSAGRRESSRRLSTKSPARGVVKPMVSGHTITKPTINLRRVNMQRVNRSSNLSAITESPATPQRNESDNETDQSETPPTNRQNRYDNKRVCRMPERLNAASSRISEENERRLSRKHSKRSGRLSGQLSHSQTITDRLSGTQNNNSEPAETIGNPLVKLNDVSKLLQNSQSVNVKMLTEQDFRTTASPENNDKTMNNSNHNVVIPETQMSIHMSDEDDESTITPNKEAYTESNNTTYCVQINKKKNLRNTYNLEDPLEGPSWLFDDQENELDTEPSNQLKNKKSMCNVTSKPKNIDDTYEENYTEQNVSLPSIKNMSYLSEQLDSSATKQEDVSDYEGNKENSFCTMIEPPCGVAKNVGQLEEDKTTNFSRFITRRRGRREINDEDIDDFTLMISRKPNRKQQFDINELRMPEIPTNEVHPEATRKQNPNRTSDVNDLELPALECSNIVPKIKNDTEPEITGKIQKRIPNCTAAIALNSSVTENMGRTTIYNIMCNDETISLPLLTDEEFYKEVMNNGSKKSHVLKKHQIQDVNLPDHGENIVHTLVQKKKGKQGKKSSSSKDPSCAKVVLQKLSEPHVRQRTPPPESNTPDDSTQSKSKSYVSLATENSSDSECSNSSISSRPDRPRRRKAPRNLREPCLNKKLRRDAP